MARTETARRDHARRGRRYSSDLTDREWGLIAPLLPGPRRLGRPRTTDLRDVVNAIHCIAATGCQWSLLPREFPPFTTVQRYFYDWRNGNLLRAINHLLVMAAREMEGQIQPLGGRYRQRERENHRKRRPARLWRRETDQGPQAAYRD